MSSKSNAGQPEKLQGLVVRNNGASYLVRLDASGQEVECRIKGNFRIRGIRTTNPVAVGDRVEVLPSDRGNYICAIHPRKNYIIRRASNLSKESHILASNLDQAILVASLREPQTSTTFIDRFLATAEAYRIPAAIIINKADLWDDEDAELADAIRYLYSTIGYPVLFSSTVTGRGHDEIVALTRDRISLLAGNSGVGKSSLINSLIPGANLKTSDISDIHHTGTHTTTFSEMLTLPYGGEIIDVPGVKAFGVIDFAPEEISHYFPEIFATARQCRYSDCKHVNEPGCAVKSALDDQKIAQSRYTSYLSILEEASGADKYRKPQ